MKILKLAAASLIGLSSLTWAGSINPNVIDSDAKWFFHLNNERLNESELLKVFKPEIEKKIKNAKELQLIGFNPLTDLNSVTMYGNSYQRTGSVLILDGQFNSNEILTLAKEQFKNQSSDYRGYQILFWGQGVKSVYVAFYDNTKIVFARDLDTLKKAVDVMDGTAKNISQSENTLLDNAYGNIVTARVVDFNPKIKKPMKSKLFKNITEMTYNSGEEGSQMSSQLSLKGADLEVSSLLKDMVTGLKALLLLTADQQKVINTFLKPIQINQDGESVNISLKTETDELINMIKECKKLKAAKKK